MTSRRRNLTDEQTAQVAAQLLEKMTRPDPAPPVPPPPAPRILSAEALTALDVDGLGSYAAEVMSYPGLRASHSGTHVSPFWSMGD